MRSHVSRLCLAASLLAAVIVSASACDKLTFPRLSWEQKAPPRLPISVTYVFDPQLSQKTERIDACGLPYTLDVGTIVTQTVLDASADRLANVAVLQTHTSATPVAVSSDLVIRLTLERFAFVPITKTGEEDRYQAEIELRLRAVYQDAQGNVLAQTPLTYQERVNVWAPALSSQSTSCATGQFDGVVRTAAETLAEELLSAVPSLFGQPQAPTTVQAPAPIPPQLPRHPQATKQQAPGLAFRTRLQDGNDNLILEGGEVIVLNVEVTNKGTAPISTAFLEVNGSPVLVNAFQRVTSFPIKIGPLLPGEMQSMEVRGRMPDQVEPQQAELIVTIKPADGRPPGPHKILASIEPFSRSSNEAGPDARPSSVNSRHTETSPAKGTNASLPYYAMIVALDRYRDQWPKAHTISPHEVEGLVDTLHATGLFSGDHIHVLHGTQATRANIERTLLSLIRPRLNPKAVLLVYFAGNAVADPSTGEVYLLPYEGSPRTSKSQLISLRQLQRVLGKLPTRVSLLLLDTPVVHVLGSKEMIGLNGHAKLKWHAAIPRPVKTHPIRVIQIRRLPHKTDGEPPKLFSGLLGRADRNQDGQVTIAEFLEDLKGAADIRPLVSGTHPIARLPLAR